MTQNSNISLLTRGTSFTVAELAAAYVAQYNGRDNAMQSRLGWWVDRFANRVATEITEDDILYGLDALRDRGSLRNVAGFLFGL